MKIVPQKYFDGRMAEFNQRFPVVMQKFVFHHLKKSIRENEEVCKLYRIENTNVIAVVPRKDYLLTLEQLLVSFIESEEYELASQCQDEITQFHINRVIEESKGEP